MTHLPRLPLAVTACLWFCAMSLPLVAKIMVNGSLPKTYEGQTVEWLRESLETRDVSPVAAATVHDGRFSLEAPNGPGLFALRIDAVQTPFVAADDQTLTATLSADAKAFTFSGSDDHNRFLAYEETRKASLARHVQSVRDAAKLARAANDQAEVDRLIEAEVAGYLIHRRELNDHTLAHLSNSAALYAASLRWDGDYRLDDLAAQVDAYAAAHPGADISRLLQERIARFRAVAIGAFAPDLSGPGPNGQVQTLRELRGRHVLVDFWAAWCAPCRQENRHYVDLYQRFHDKGLEILAVSVDQNEKAWKSAIQQDNATWRHLSDLTGWKSPLAARYNVAALPASFLLDPEGRIIAKDVRGPALDALLEARLNGTMDQRRADEIAAQTLAQFATQSLSAEQLAFTIIDLTDPARPRRASYRGDAVIYPASVIKLFYLAATHRWLEDGKLTDTPELRRALKDMIVDSSNDATAYIVDLLTDTTSGPELSETDLAAWVEKRGAVTRYFTALGYEKINASKKPWSDGPYGRESQAAQRYEPRRNWLTTDATARLLAEIATGRAVTPARSAEMMTLLRRDPTAPTNDPDDQARFTGTGLPVGAKLWSKAGWTSSTRHDAAYIELPDGRRLVLVVFTTDHANNRAILPAVARLLCAP